LTFQTAVENEKPFTESPLPPLLELPNDPSSDNENEKSLNENRLVDIDYYTNQLLNLGNHKPFDCGPQNLKIVSKVTYGLKTCISFQCSMCNKIEKVWTHKLSTEESTSRNDINTVAVTSALCSGLTFEMLNHFFAGLNMPFFTSATFYKVHNKIEDAISKITLEDMLKAGKEELDIAESKGQFCYIRGKKYVWIAVTVDGTWLKRSYKGNYSSLIGAVSL